MRLLRTEVRGADHLAPGVYWGVVCSRVGSTEGWVELLDAVPLRRGEPDTRIGSWLGTRDGVVRQSLGPVQLILRDGERRVASATPAMFFSTRL